MPAPSWKNRSNVDTGSLQFRYKTNLQRSLIGLKSLPIILILKMFLVGGIDIFHLAICPLFAPNRISNLTMDDLLILNQISFT